MTLAGSSVVNVFFRCVGLIVSILLTWFTARLGAEERGVYSIFCFVAQLFISAFAGLGPALSFRISRYKEDPWLYIPGLLHVSLALGCLFSFFLIVFDVSFWNGGDELIILAISSPFLLIVPCVNGLYLAEGRFLQFGLNNIFVSLGCVISLSVLLLACGRVSLSGVLYTWASMQFFASMGAVLGLRKKIVFRAVERVKIKFFALYSVEVGVANLISTLNYRIVLFVVGYFIGFAAVGIYSLAVVMAEMLWIVSSSIAMAAYGRIGSKEVFESGRLVAAMARLNFILLAASSPVLYFMAKFFLPLLFGDVYEESLPALLALLPGVVLFGTASVISVFFTNQLGRPDIPKRISFISFVLNCLMSVVLVPRYGLFGAGVSTSIAYSLSAIFYLFVFSRFLNLGFFQCLFWKVKSS